MPDETRSARAGLAFGVGAYALWGAMPIYFLQMAPAGPFEIVGWRIVFSLVFCALLIAATRAWRPFGAVLRDRRSVLLLGLGGVLIYANWTIYVSATTTQHVVEAALGYFINPIVTVLLGVLVLHERLRPAQWAAVGLSGVAVLVLAVESGAMPWISLGLAFSFGLYGLVKKQVGTRVDVLSGLTLETAWLTPVAAVQLAVLAGGPGLVLGTAAYPTLMLASAGVGTAVPLLLFAASTRRLPLSVAGFLQYLAPILQLATGVLVLREPMSAARWTGFGIVWLALALLVGESLLRGRARRRPAPAPAL